MTSAKDQIRDASVSVMSNIAEGFERSGTGEFAQFLAIAKGSAGEVRSELYVALDQEYIDDSVFRALSTDAQQISRIKSDDKWTNDLSAQLRTQGNKVQEARSET